MLNGLPPFYDGIPSSLNPDTLPLVIRSPPSLANISPHLQKTPTKCIEESCKTHFNSLPP